MTVQAIKDKRDNSIVDNSSSGSTALSLPLLFEAGTVGVEAEAEEA